MKKTISKVMGLAFLSVMAITTSCSSDDDKGGEGSSSFVLDRNNLRGDINDGEVILESGTYKLTGGLVVNNNAKLIIKEGVVIEATAVANDDDFGAVRYIAVAQGGKIDVQGSSTKPVVMTTEVKEPGKWGGLVICGKAPINKGFPAQAEVSGLLYGGSDADDNSGSIRYLRIEYAGFAYNSEKEFNGLSMFGVGKGTTIEYVQIHESSDDGFEWFGGTVDSNYLVVTNFHEEVGDDLFDWTEGWVGKGENWYGIRTNDGNRGIEADNNGTNHLATPIANPTIKNITLIGSGSDDTSSEHQAVKMRVGTKGQFENFVISKWKVGFDIQHDAGVGYALDGGIKATRVRFENVGTKSIGKNTAGETIDVSGLYTEDNTATGAGNGTGKPAWANGWTVGL